MVKKEKKSPRGDKRRKDAPALIAELFRSLPDKRYSVKSLMAAVGATTRDEKERVRGIVRDLAAEGVIEQVSEGKYRLSHSERETVEGTVDMTPEELEGKSVFLWMESVESGKRRMFQGTWQQQDEDGLYSMLYDTSLSDTSQFRFTIPKMDYPLDDRYEVNIVIRDRDKAVRIQTENHLYDTEAS